MLERGLNINVWMLYFPFSESFNHVLHCRITSKRAESLSGVCKYRELNKVSPSTLTLNKIFELSKKSRYAFIQNNNNDCRIFPFSFYI